MSTLTLRFGRFELQPAERRLLAEGRELPLGGRAFDLLVFLATQPGRLVTKAELLDRVWAGLVVEEANLTVQVSNLRKVLGDDVIATIPGRGYRFVAPVDAANDERMAAAGPVTTDAGTDARDDAPPAVARVAPPPLLVGRDDDLARVEAALAAPGCHTLTGPAGVGKTSLAQAVAARWAAHVVWVDLVTVTGPGQVMLALARALGQAAPEDGQPEMLAGRLAAGTLLVLDNAEHVADGVLALLQALRPQAAGLHALVTSQVPVAWQGERVLPLGPLPLPPAGLPDAQALTHGAVGLLAARIAAADPRIAIGTAQRPLLTAVAQALDGLPLALEMAAARVPLLGLQGVHDALEQRFALLRSRQRGVADRHQRCTRRWTGAMACWRPMSRRCSARSASSPAASRSSCCTTWPAMPMAIAGRWWTAWRCWSTARWSPPTTPTRRAIACSRRCGTTRSSAWWRRATRPGRGAATRALS